MNAFAFRLGDKLRDRVTGVEGTVISRTQYLNGCVRYGLQPEGAKPDGAALEASWVDEAQAAYVTCTGMTVPELHEAGAVVGRPGGPQPAPMRAPDAPVR